MGRARAIAAARPLGQTESIFALSNGHIGLRGNLDEGEPHAAQGTYLNGYYETLPLPYAEGGYGYPEEGQSLINVTDGKLIRLLVDDEPFDVRYGTLVHHERVLDLRAGVLRRDVHWVSTAGQAVRIRSTRLVSFVQRAVVAVHYEVEAVDAPARIVVQSPLVANEPGPEEEVDDPRAAAALRAPLVSQYSAHHDLQVELGHQTRRSGLRMAAALDHVIDGPPGTITATDGEADMGRVTISTELAPGQRLTVTKFLAYGWSSVRSMPALRDQVDAALLAARRDRLGGAPRRPARVPGRCLGRRGCGGRGRPGASAGGAVCHLPGGAGRRARPAARHSGQGADRSGLRWPHLLGHGDLSPAGPDVHPARGRPRRAALALTRSLTWPATGPASCDWPVPRSRGGRFVARNAPATGRPGPRRSTSTPISPTRCVATSMRPTTRSSSAGPGLELLVETARLWLSLGHHDAEGCFRIDGVTGPDEYSALVDNNVFTNLMAARNLRAAADTATRYPQRAADLGVEAAEIEAWRNAAGNMVVPFDHELGVTSQSGGFTRYRHWDFAATPPEDYPLLLHYPYYLLYSSQVIKQADLVLALYLCGDAFSAEQKRRDFDYYEAITVRDSTLSASMQAIVAAETGRLRLAYDYFRESALVDLHDLAGNTADGLHLASLAGAWLVAVAGFGGMRDYGEMLAFAPRLPAELTRLCVRLVYRGRRLRIEISPGEARYELLAGEPLELLHHGEPFTLEARRHRRSGHARSPRRSRPPSVRRRDGNPAGAVWAPRTAAPGWQPPPSHKQGAELLVEG